MRDWISQATEADLEDLDRLITESAAAGTSEPGAPAAGKWTARTLGEVAQFLGLALQTVKDLRTGPDPMPGTEGNYPLPEIVRWRFSKLQHMAKPSGSKADKEEAAIEIANARALLKLRRESGELVSRSAAKIAVVQLFNRLRGQLEPLPELLATTLPPAARADFLLDARQRLHNLLVSMANWQFDTEISDDSARNKTPSPTPAD